METHLYAKPRAALLGVAVAKAVESDAFAHHVFD
jgi:hypothetical protein